MPRPRPDDRDHGQLPHQARELGEHAARPGSVDEARTEDGDVEVRAGEERVGDALRAPVGARARQVDVLRREDDDAAAAARAAGLDERRRPADVHAVGERRVEPPRRGGRAEMDDGVGAGSGRGEALGREEVADHGLDGRRGRRRGRAADEEARHVPGGHQPRGERRADEARRAGDEDPSHAAAAAPGSAPRASARRRSRPSDFLGSGR